ncbi:MAG: hypothetical protein AUH21_03685 [Nitrospirae bacterium 13_2_20CM_62_7]|nr:MAG: hypothetical protein AUH21_03685 [Nitrospirae bacterium 13_2_20CM_62_7]
MKIERFEDLECWKHARILTGLVYDLCETKPLGRDGRLRDQVTGAAISVMNNIAEGFGSQSNSEFKRFLGYARRSVSEVQSCLYVASDRKFVASEEFHSAYEQSEVTRKVIDGLLRYLRTKRTQLTKRT